MYVTAIIAAGGRGERFGAGQPKQLVSIGGRTMLERSVDAFLTHAAVNDVIVALPAELAVRPPAYLTQTAKPLRIVAGGARRQDSVAAAFGVVAASTDVIVVHDAARPFASADLIARTIERQENLVRRWRRSPPATPSNRSPDRWFARRSTAGRFISRRRRRPSA
jgi:2-C-methyl-D-erythritol 4-phosphate cytidylyltransferase/2-C-methyl-D-erythritol 2,4-cyclodiphosphate synthase